MRIFINAIAARLGGGQIYLLKLLRRVPQDEGWKVFLLGPEIVETTWPLKIAGAELDTHRVYHRAFGRAAIAVTAATLNVGRLGILINPGDVGPLAKAVSKFRELPVATVRSWLRAFRQRAISDCPIQRIAAGMRSMYRSLVCVA